MIKKLRMKFIIINMSIVTIMLCVIFSLVYNFTEANLETQSIHLMQDIAESPLHGSIPYDIEADLRMPYFSFRLDSAGNVITIGGAYSLSDEQFLDKLREQSLGFKKRTGVLEEYNLRYCLVENLHGKSLVFVDISNENATLDNLMKTSLLIGTAAFLIFLWISILLSKWVAKPVDTALKQQKQFIADASHELKTPLTVIITNGQILNDTGDDEASSKKYVRNILEMCGRMRGLIEEMMELAKTDSYHTMLKFDEIDLSRVISDSVLPFDPIFFECSLSLETDIEPGVFVRGDEEQLKRLIEILLDNARKYSYVRGNTKVELKKQGKCRCLLSVANEGEPLSEEQLKDIFKRFYRGDKARKYTGSCGLGLSIAQNIVAEHKGRIWAKSSGGINTCFAEFPCS